MVDQHHDRLLVLSRNGAISIIFKEKMGKSCNVEYHVVRDINNTDTVASKVSNSYLKKHLEV